MGRVIAGVVAGFVLGFGCALLTSGRSSADQTLGAEELSDQQDLAQQRADKAERQMLRETRKRPVLDRDSSE